MSVNLRQLLHTKVKKCLESMEASNLYVTVSKLLDILLEKCCSLCNKFKSSIPFLMYDKGFGVRHIFSEANSC